MCSGCCTNCVDADNCKCMTEYTNSKGAVSRRVGKARFVDVPYEPPHRMTAEEATEKGGFSQPRRLTGGENGGIINTREPLSSFLNSSEQLYENAKKIIPLPDYQDIVIHGDKTGFSYKDKDGNETLLNVGEFTKILKESGLYKGGKIRLISCEAAAPGAHTAQWFANDMGVEVLAPTDIVWVDRDGNMTIGPDEFTDSGAWITIEPETEG